MISPMRSTSAKQLRVPLCINLPKEQIQLQTGRASQRCPAMQNEVRGNKGKQEKQRCFGRGQQSVTVASLFMPASAYGAGNRCQLLRSPHAKPYLLPHHCHWLLRSLQTRTDPNGPEPKKKSARTITNPKSARLAHVGYSRRLPVNLDPFFSAWLLILILFVPSEEAH
ncbi:hypothetical protein EYF80_026832 [Liparis tanakae]|uniref:Uncharacterized protein n=1 Tax=Liparis tanakae TaxID=230148 RepID=A0A4Z2HDU0_9TELE|nr:hypothetical protein EYF80_026832 [Liparis tanakae]